MRTGPGEARTELGFAPRTIALELRIARAAIRWAERERLVPPSMVFRFPRVRFDRRKYVLNHRTPTPDEVRRVVAALADDDWRLAIVLIARTGARVGEVVSLRGCDLDEAEGILDLGTVPGAMKTGWRRFPLDAASLRALRGRSRRGTAPLLDLGACRAPIQRIHRTIARACAATNVPVFTPHGLRRMVVVRLLKARVDPGTAASLTGHSVQVMLRYYQDISDHDRRAAAEAAHLGLLGAPATAGRHQPVKRLGHRPQPHPRLFHPAQLDEVEHRVDLAGRPQRDPVVVRPHPPSPHAALSDVERRRVRRALRLVLELVFPSRPGAPPHPPRHRHGLSVRNQGLEVERVHRSLHGPSNGAGKGPR